MAKFSSISSGTHARRDLRVPMPDGSEMHLAIVPLLVSQVLDALSAATAAAVARGLKSPKDGDPIFEMYKWANVAVLCCVDPESPQDAPEPYFDGGVKQILDPKSGLDRDRLALIYAAWEQWQEECSPRPDEMSPAEYLAAVLDHAREDHSGQLPFRRWRLATQDSWVRFMAHLLTELLQLKSLFGPTSPDESTSFDSSAGLLERPGSETSELGPPVTTKTEGA